MDADSNAGQVWILGMPFFRKYYSSFQFVQKKGKVPIAASMSFSEQDGNCSPGNAPAPFEKEHAQTMAKTESSESDSVNQRSSIGYLCPELAQACGAHNENEQGDTPLRP